MEMLESIRYWQSVLRESETCTRLVLAGKTEEAAEIMRRLSEAEADLLSFRVEREIPNTLLEWFQAHADRGCDHCWFSSAQPTHPECAQKIHHYFAARDALQAWVPPVN